MRLFFFFFVIHKTHNTMNVRGPIELCIRERVNKPINVKNGGRFRSRENTVFLSAFSLFCSIRGYTWSGDIVCGELNARIVLKE